jgi:hypothetical protein
MKRACSFVMLAIAVLLAAGFAGGARADGLPVLGVDVGGTGVASAAGDVRYVTLPAGRGTVVARVSPVGGRVLGSSPLAGEFTIPAVAYDGSASGLSADGRILVLIEPRQSFPRTKTTFTVLAAPRLRPLRVVRLRGDFSFDAISPHGTLMYLIQYTVPTDPSRYLVRAYNLHTGRLLAKPVTDPREQADKMRGSPITRTTSLDGRVAYTLYDGAGSTPFVHALDTSHQTAHCIDLDMLVGNTHLWQLRLTLTNHGRTLTAHNGNDAEAIIDTRTFQASPVSPLASASQQGTHPIGSTIPWTLVAFCSVSLLALLAALTLTRRRRQRPATAQ